MSDPRQLYMDNLIRQMIAMEHVIRWGSEQIFFSTNFSPVQCKILFLFWAEVKDAIRKEEVINP